jgi:hypothetical protein
MVATHKTAHPSEKEALEYMRKRLFGSASIPDNSPSNPGRQGMLRDKAAPPPELERYTDS